MGEAKQSPVAMRKEVAKKDWALPNPSSRPGHLNKAFSESEGRDKNKKIWKKPTMLK